MFAVVYLPNFSLQAVLRYERELESRPVALTGGDQPKPLIIQVNRSAHECGVVSGLSPSQATARCEKLVIKSRSVAQEDSATDVLLQTAYEFSPNIEATAPGVCTMELKGLGIGIEAAANAWAEKLRTAFASYFLEAQIGIAPTPALALLAARVAKPVLVAFTPAEFIPTLPIEALEPSPEILEILSGWGIRSAGEFLALGKEAVVERLGAPALELFKRVSPGAIRPLHLVSPAQQFSERMEFEHEIETAEPLLFVLRRFVEQVTRRLEAVYLTAAGLDLRLKLASGATWERFFKLPSPTNEIEILFRMLQTHLETVRTDSPIIALQLTAKAGQSDSHQFGLFETTLRNPNRFAETLARLTGLCGSDRVGTPALKATHRPDAFQMSVPNFSSAQASAPPAASGGPQLRRFRPPLPASIEYWEQQPASLRSSVASGRIKNVRGPFFSSGDWWDNGLWAREEWDVETAGGALLRIFRSNEGSFVEGVYD
jgi:protein ImuB